MAFTNVFLIGGALVLALGALLLKRGRWPRRVGQTPHCPKCDYILAGDGTRCSECGTPFNVRNIVRGERPRRAGPTWTGIVLAIIGLALLSFPITNDIRSIQWIHYEPLSWLLSDLGSGNPGASLPAWVEIQRRISENRLSDSDQSEVVDKGLQIRTLGITAPWNRNAILNYVGDRYSANKLSAAQTDLFFGGMLKANLFARPVVGSLSPVPYLLSAAGRGPDGWQIRMNVLAASIDDAPFRKFDNGGSGSLSGWSSLSTLDPVGTPGKHRLHLKVDLAVNSGNRFVDASAPLASHKTQDLIADFQVVTGATPIATVTSPGVSTLQPLLKPWLRVTGTNPTWMTVTVDAMPLPVNVAFDVFLRFNGKEYPAGGVNFRAGSNGAYSTGAQGLPAELPDAMDVIFRSSQTVARGTLDLTQIWNGQIVIPNVPLQVVHRPPRTVPTTTHARGTN